MKLTPIYKGLIIGPSMVAVTLLFYYTKIAPGSTLHFIPFVIYMGGVIWAVIDYAKSRDFTGGNFAEHFGQGFRCFIIVTLIMVAFTTVFSMMHPEFAEDAAKTYKEQLIKEKNTLPAQIDEQVAKVKKQYTTAVVSITIFRYLILGALFSAAASGGLILIRRRV